MIDKSEPRRFPPPWVVEELDACFVVTDNAGQKLAYVYFENEPGRQSAAKFTRDEARRIAANIAKLPELLPTMSALGFILAALLLHHEGTFSSFFGGPACHGSGFGFHSRASDWGR
jgi:hypothetical protein